MDAPAVQYVTTSDGYNIAYTVSGEGRPLVCTPLGMFNHVQLNWRRPWTMQSWLQGLSERFRLIHYDSRGMGLSTRGLPESFSWGDFYSDLEAVVEGARLDRFVLLGCFVFSPAAVRYAVEHAERVDALVLFLATRSMTPWSRGIWDVLAHDNWELFLRTWLPVGLSPAEADSHLAMLRQSITQRDYLLAARAAGDWDISGLLSQVRQPTLVLHPRDQVYLSEEEAVALAAAIPDSRLVLIDGGVSIFGDGAAGARAVEEFLASLPPHKERPAPPAASGATPNGLSAREIEVLRLIAAGKSNQQIADELVISIFTVNHHVSSIYNKTGAANRAEATSYAHRHSLV